MARAEGALLAPPGSAGQQVSVAIRSMVESRLREVGVPAYYSVRGGGWWDLAGELEDILRHARMSARDRLAWLHRQSSRYERVAALALDRLQRLAREVYAPWPLTILPPGCSLMTR